MLNRNLIILIFSQIFSFTVAPVTVLLSGIIASGMIDIKYIATLPTALTVVGTAIGSVFASYLMSIKGRKFGFIFSSLMSSFAALLASFAVFNDYFIIYFSNNLSTFTNKSNTPEILNNVPQRFEQDLAKLYKVLCNDDYFSIYETELGLLTLNLQEILSKNPNTF